MDRFVMARRVLIFISFTFFLGTYYVTEALAATEFEQCIVNQSDKSINIVGSVRGKHYKSSILVNGNYTCIPRMFTPIRLNSILRSNSNSPIEVEIEHCSKSNTIILKPATMFKFDIKCPKKLQLASTWFYEFIGDPINRMYQGFYGKSDPAVAAPRGNEDDEIQIPMLQPGISFITPGFKKLVIKWVDGKPPFSIDLVQNNNFIERSIEGMKREWRIPSVQYIKGEYLLRLKDGNNKIIERSLSVTKLPDYPSWYSEMANLSEKDIDLVTAIWLHDLSLDRRWSLEAYNILADREDGPALIVKQAIKNDEELNIPW